MYGDSKSTNERGPCLVGLLGLSCRYKRFLFCLGCSSRPGIIFSSPYTISIPLAPSPSMLGRQSCWVACLLVCVSGIDFHLTFPPSFYELTRTSPSRPQETILSQLFLCFLRKPFLSIHTHGKYNPSDRTPINCKKVHKCTPSCLAKTASPPPIKNAVFRILYLG